MHKPSRYMIYFDQISENHKTRGFGVRTSRNHDKGINSFHLHTSINSVSATVRRPSDQLTRSKVMVFSRLPNNFKWKFMKNTYPNRRG
jgi:hypothetical protein